MTIDNKIRVEQLKGFTSTLATNGYTVLPGGLIIQWGSITVSGGDVTIDFSVPFPNKILNKQATVNAKDATSLRGPWSLSFDGDDSTTGPISSVKLYNYDPSAGGLYTVHADWLIIGY